MATPWLGAVAGTSDIAYENGVRDFDELSGLGIPVLFFSKNIGHGGGSARGGDFTKIRQPVAASIATPRVCRAVPTASVRFAVGWAPNGS